MCPLRDLATPLTPRTTKPLISRVTIAGICGDSWMFSLTHDEFEDLAPLLWPSRALRRPAERRKRSRTHVAPQRLDPRRLGRDADLRMIALRSRRVAGLRSFN